MRGAIIEAVKSAIDLRKKAREDSKIGREIQKLEQERLENDLMIDRGIFEDVEKYDPIPSEAHNILILAVVSLVVLLSLFGGSLLELVHRILGR